MQQYFAHYTRKDLLEDSFKLISDGFNLWVVSFIILFVSSLIGKHLFSTILELVSLLLFLLGLLWLYRGSKQLSETVPKIGEELYKAIRYYAIAILLLILSPLFGILFPIAILAAIGLFIASIYHLYLYASWLEEELSKKQFANITITLLILGTILSVKYMPLPLSIIGLIMEITALISLSTMTKKCKQTCINKIQRNMVTVQ
ncbi:MAG: hypothetical protein GSR77_04310 [Desulfurococcales archaeon]|nr:hypothetical protein [Desulfurococcales archaeon]